MSSNRSRNGSGVLNRSSLLSRSSLLGRLGVQNGDMVRTLNGFGLTDPNAILQAYAQLRDADHLTLHIVRRGSPVSMDYQIQ